MLGNVDVTFTADTGRAGWWRKRHLLSLPARRFQRRGAAHRQGGGPAGHQQHRGRPEAVKIYEAWYEHRFFDERLSLLAGLHDYNSEFDVLEYASDFLNSSFGISPDISQVGPSIFPTTALAPRGSRRSRPAGSYLLAALYDGVPGDPELPQAQLTSAGLLEGRRLRGAGSGSGARGTRARPTISNSVSGGWVRTRQGRRISPDRPTTSTTAST